MKQAVEVRGGKVIEDNGKKEWLGESEGSGAGRRRLRGRESVDGGGETGGEMTEGRGERAGGTEEMKGKARGIQVDV